MHAWGERITFDANGKEVVLSNHLGKDVMLPPSSPPAEPTKKKRKKTRKISAF
jgi:hypothetical protein